MRQWLAVKLTIPQVPAKALKQHVAIYRAIAARDKEAARVAMWTHLEDTAFLVSEVVKNRRKGTPNGQLSTGKTRTSKAR